MWKIMKTGVAVKEVETNGTSCDVFVPSAFYTDGYKEGDLITVTRSLFDSGDLMNMPASMYFRQGVPYICHTPCRFRWDSDKERYVYSFEKYVIECTLEELQKNPFHTEVVFESSDMAEIRSYCRGMTGYDFSGDMVLICDSEFDTEMSPDGTWYIIQGSESRPVKVKSVRKGIKAGEVHYVCEIE